MAHNEARIKIRTTGCPACSHQTAYRVGLQVFRCAQCEALYGQCYLGESYHYVLPYFVETEPPAETTRYFDLTCLGSGGICRRHGWYGPATRRIVQVG
jgi:hypothetical protein